MGVLLSQCICTFLEISTQNLCSEVEDLLSQVIGCKATKGVAPRPPPGSFSALGTTQCTPRRPDRQTPQKRKVVPCSWFKKKMSFVLVLGSMLLPQAAAGLLVACSTPRSPMGATTSSAGLVDELL